MRALTSTWQVNVDHTKLADGTRSHTSAGHIQDITSGAVRASIRDARIAIGVRTIYDTLEHENINNGDRNTA